eukprot:gene9145-1233_t
MKENLVFILIDVQKGFTGKDGSFGIAYSSIDLLQIQETLPNIKSCLELCQENNIPTIIVRSEYKHNQFKTKGLEKLCVIGENNDCDFSPGVFENIKNPTIITKYENSAMTQNEFSDKIDEFIQNGCSKLLMGGFSTNTCVKKTSLDLKKKYKDKIEIIIAKDLTASRSDIEKKDEEGRFDSKKFLQAVGELTKNDVHFVNSYIDILK